MPSSSLRRSAALASALAVGSTALVAGAPTATASLPGSGNVLTTSNNTTTIRFYNDPNRTTLENHFDQVRHAAWSPDGSMAVYVDPLNGISALRWDAGYSFTRIAPDDAVTDRESPTWRGNGSGFVWAEKGAGTPWRIRSAPSSAWADFGGQLSPVNDSNHYRNPDGALDGRVVFQRQADSGGQPSGPASVVLYDPAKPVGERISVVDDNGSNPAISPNGDKVAFVRGNQIVESDLNGDNEVIVAADSGQLRDHPTWSPDGNTIAFTQGSGIATAPANGSAAANPTVIAGATGIPAYQPRNRDRVARLAGQSRFTTATAVSQSHWKTATNTADNREQAQSVVLSRSDTFADALSGSALAAAKRGPLLMTPPTSLEAATKAEIQRVLAPGGTVYLLGSPGAISTGVEDAVRGLGFTVVRLAGADRFSTSVAIAKAIDPTPDLVLLATGMNFPDALAAGAAAGSYNYPGSTESAVVVLTNEAVLPPATKGFLDTLPNAERVLFGVGRFAAQAAVNYDANAVEVWGESRYETALFTAWTFFGGQRHVGLATGSNWPDALAGGALMGLLNGPLLLTPGTATVLGFEAEFLLAESSGSTATTLIFGSAAVVTDGQRDQAGYWMSGPLGAATVTNPIDVGLTARSGTDLRTTGAPATGTVRTAAEAAQAAKTVREHRSALR